MAVWLWFLLYFVIGWVVTLISIAQSYAECKKCKEEEQVMIFTFEQWWEDEVSGDPDMYFAMGLTFIFWPIVVSVWLLYKSIKLTCEIIGGK